MPYVDQKNYPVFGAANRWPPVKWENFIINNL